MTALCGRRLTSHSISLINTVISTPSYSTVDSTPDLPNMCTSPMKSSYKYSSSETNSVLYSPTQSRNQIWAELQTHDRTKLDIHPGSPSQEKHSLLNKLSAIAAPIGRQKRHVGVVEFSQEPINDLELATPASVCSQKCSIVSSWVLKTGRVEYEVLRRVGPVGSVYYFKDYWWYVWCNIWVTSSYLVHSIALLVLFWIFKLLGDSL